MCKATFVNMADSRKLQIKWRVFLHKVLINIRYRTNLGAHGHEWVIYFSQSCYHSIDLCYCNCKILINQREAEAKVVKCIKGKMWQVIDEALHLSNRMLGCSSTIAVSLVWSVITYWALGNLDKTRHISL